MLLNSTTMRIKTCYNSLNKYFYFGSVKAEVSHIKAPHRYNLKNAVKVQVVHSVSSNAHVMGQSVEAQHYYYDRHHLHLFSFGGISRSEEYFHSPQNDLVDGSLQENGQKCIIGSSIWVHLFLQKAASEQHFHSSVQGLEDYPH